MSGSDDELCRRVDEVLDASWPHERRLAVRRLALAEFGRVALGMGALWLLSVVVFALFSVTVPWTFFVVVGAIATVAVLHGVAAHEHLRN